MIIVCFLLFMPYKLHLFKVLMNVLIYSKQRIISTPKFFAIFTAITAIRRSLMVFLIQLRRSSHTWVHRRYKKIIFIFASVLLLDTLTNVRYCFLQIENQVINQSPFSIMRKKVVTLLSFFGEKSFDAKRL